MQLADKSIGRPVGTSRNLLRPNERGGSCVSNFAPSEIRGMCWAGFPSLLNKLPASILILHHFLISLGSSLPYTYIIYSPSSPLILHFPPPTAECLPLLRQYTYYPQITRILEHCIYITISSTHCILISKHNLLPPYHQGLFFSNHPTSLFHDYAFHHLQVRGSGPNISHRDPL